MNRVHLSRQLVLEAPDRVADGAGGFSEVWVAKGTLWADVRAGTGRAKDGGELSLSAVGLRIVVRGAPQGSAQRPAPGMRFREGTRLFLISAVAERDFAGRFLTCFATEEVAT